MLPHFPPKSHLKRKNENSKFNTMFKFELVTKNYLLVKFGFVYLSLNIIPHIMMNPSSKSFIHEREIIL